MLSEKIANTKSYVRFHLQCKRLLWNCNTKISGQEIQHLIRVSAECRLKQGLNCTHGRMQAWKWCLKIMKIIPLSYFDNTYIYCSVRIYAQNWGVYAIIGVSRLLRESPPAVTIHAWIFSEFSRWRPPTVCQTFPKGTNALVCMGIHFESKCTYRGR